MNRGGFVRGPLGLVGGILRVVLLALIAAWAYQNGWEDDFTLVNWDQRGTGKNWKITDGEKLAPTMSLEAMQAEAERSAASA
ncbi:hypothetical protein [Novosphingobium sp.]|uniref:hypothetical protein n=1 Tax=Novosphingobium sp. TaxID=1874826 RepID=UPI001D78C49F|nr:hypothetical protein [Novosphingobium sp.]MBX9665460.1 hypothetical protein [Novosphingobium sp.]